MRKVLYLMGTLTDEDAGWLAARGEVRFVPANTTIIHEARPIAALFVLLEGRLAVRIERLRGRDVATLYPGEVLGEISFVDARPPSASVVAVQDSHVLAVPRDMLTKKLESDNGFGSRFYRGLAVFLADRLRTTTAHLGYGKGGEEAAPETDSAIDEGGIDEISLAARRFDLMLRRLRLTDGSSR